MRALVHGLLGYALLLGLASRAVPHREEPLKSFLVREVPPAEPPTPRRESRKTTSRSGVASPRSLRAVPTEIVAPPPVIPLILPPPVIAPPRPALGPAPRPARPPGPDRVRAAAASGMVQAGEVMATGTAAATATERATARRRAGSGGQARRNADYPRALGAAGIAGTVAVRCRVGVDGRVTGCAVADRAAMPSSTPSPVA